MKLLGPALLALVVGCQDASGPIEPAWGKQACANCAMLVSDRRYAAQLVDADGAHVFFDDPGCMATWMIEHTRAPRRAWVHSGSASWVDATSTKYVSRQPSPMGFGFAPDEGGDATWADVEGSARGRAQRGEPQ